MIEPIRDHEPEPGFLEQIREITSEIGAILIMDEITSGFRLNTGGTHLIFGITPDIAVFAKAMSNGYPMAAVIGKAEVMQAAQLSFISSTYWTERIGPAAALATIRKHKQEDVSKHLIRMGELVQSGWNLAAEQTGLNVKIGGIPPLSHFIIKDENTQSAHTLFTQLMLERGFLACRSFYATYAHREEHIKAYTRNVTETFFIIGDAIKRGKLMHMLKGPVAHTGFRRLT